MGLIDGQRNDSLAVRRRTGFVPERMNFDRRATGRQFLRYMTPGWRKFSSSLKKPGLLYETLR